MAPSEQNRIVIDSTTARWQQADIAGLKTLPLYLAPDAGEKVMLERLEAGTIHGEVDCPEGEEIFILSGDLRDEYGTYGPGTWIRNPVGFRRNLGSRSGATYWVKRGHLRPMS
jgi:anti-sigma factor ChrR (cupin superfamily)